ncbi:hypothetical protein SELR_10620 [Selenomonas ruminantium subsp. lactilytica TAM6421]|uniref:Uncharacterized protein n=1 Tax=Selenomonas ruminantium subsp. lactilytica (strain NBRC 103574 / TAM6421) TaxID=927704 RepID=I0GPT3_SELRL|nr:hypothetical protein SELR_10620 [Selenomonas ruminantium subsp. lactilytica TAM6421]
MMGKKESKRDRFIRLADARTNKIINMINLLGNLSNTSSYEYTSEDVERIYNTILIELEKSKNRFRISVKPSTFSLLANENQKVNQLNMSIREAD